MMNIEKTNGVKMKLSQKQFNLFILFIWESDYNTINNHVISYVMKELLSDLRDRLIEKRNRMRGNTTTFTLKNHEMALLFVLYNAQPSVMPEISSTLNKLFLSMPSEMIRAFEKETEKLNSYS